MYACNALHWSDRQKLNHVS